MKCWFLSALTFGSHNTRPQTRSPEKNTFQNFVSFGFSGAVYQFGRCAVCGSAEILPTRRRVRSRSHHAATGPRQHDPRWRSQGRETDHATRPHREAVWETVHTRLYLYRRAPTAPSSSSYRYSVNVRDCLALNLTLSLVLMFKHVWLTALRPWHSL